MLIDSWDVGKHGRMVWKCSLKCLAHAPIVLVFLLLSLGQGKGWAVPSERMSEVNIKTIFLGSGCWFINRSAVSGAVEGPQCLANITSTLPTPEESFPAPPAGPGLLQGALLSVSNAESYCSTASPCHSSLRTPTYQTTRIQLDSFMVLLPSFSFNVLTEDIRK